MATTPSPKTAPLGADDLAELERLLDAVPAPLEPLDLMMLDGFLCGVLLQPGRIPPAQWLPHITDVDEARALPRDFPAQALHDLVARRFHELSQAIEQRQWFDPWILEMDEDDTSPLDTVMPWVTGLATAIDLYPSVLQTEDQRVLEGQALLYRAFDPDDLEDADALLEVMSELEPPEDLEEVVEDLVTGVFLLADVTHPVEEGSLVAPAAVPQPAAPRPDAQRSTSQRPAPAKPAQAGHHAQPKPAGRSAQPGRPPQPHSPGQPARPAGKPPAQRPSGAAPGGGGRPAKPAAGPGPSGARSAARPGQPAAAGKPAGQPAGSRPSRGGGSARPGSAQPPRNNGPKKPGGGR